MSFYISASVISDDQADILKAGEVLARAAIGLGLEGINVSVNVSTVEDDDETADQPDGS